MCWTHSPCAVLLPCHNLHSWDEFCSHGAHSKKAELLLPQLRTSETPLTKSYTSLISSAMLCSLCCQFFCASSRKLVNNFQLCQFGEDRRGVGWEGEMGRSYFSLSPSVLIILHPAPIITEAGFAGWPDQENTLHALQPLRSLHARASLLASWWVSSCFSRATSGAANADTAPQKGEQAAPAAPSHRTFLSLQSAPHLRNSDFGSDGRSAC